MPKVLRDRGWKFWIFATMANTAFKPCFLAQIDLISDAHMCTSYVWTDLSKEGTQENRQQI